MMLVVTLTATTFGADGLEADADNFVGTIPGGSNSGNNHSATQAAGTTVAYVFSALIGADNQANNNVFAAAGDTVTVGITRSGDWLASGGVDFADFTAYDAQQTGTIRVTVPCDATVGTVKTMSVDLSATVSNGKALNPNEKSLNFNITASAGNTTDCPVAPPANAAPTVDASITGSDSVNEGTAGTYSIGATDPDGDTLTYSWTIESGNATLSGLTNTSSVSVNFTDGPSTIDLQVVVGDGRSGHNVTRNLSISELNVAPTAALGNGGSVTEGSTGTVSFTSQADASAIDATAGFKYSYDFDNDGAFEVANSTSATATVPASFLADGPATRMVSGRIADKDGGYTDYTTSIGVDNAAPVVAVPAWQNSTINCGQSATLGNISFTDAGVNDSPWTVAIDWEDDGVDDFSTNVTTQGPQANQSHTYMTPGTYTAKVTVTDKDSGAGFNETAAGSALTVNQHYLTTFLAPLDGSAPSKLIANTMKKGRVVPIKVTILDNCTGEWVSDPTTSVNISVKTATFTTNSTDAVETFSDAGSSSAQTTAMRFNADSTMASGGFWMYNLDTNGLQIGTTYEVRPKIGTAAQSTSTFALIKPTK